MFAAPHTVPLSRRLVDRYFAFALGGLLLCLATTLALAMRGSLMQWVSVAALGPSLVLLLGAIVLARTARRSSAIDSELQRLALAGDLDAARLQQLPGDEPIILAWNAVVDRLSRQRSLASLEQDVTRALQKFGEHRLLDVISSLPDGIALTDAAGRIQCANPALCSLTGAAAPDRLTGESLLEALRVAQAANGPDVQQAFKAAGGPAVAELHRTQNIEDGVWRISRHPIGGGADASRLVWTVRDVTQQALAAHARNDFVATATHELRTPLANIQAYAETLVNHTDIDVEQTKEFCNIINAEATRLSRFVKEMLNVSQLEAGALTADRRETDLERLLQNVVEHVRPQMTQKDINFSVKLPPKFPKVAVDKDLFQAALVNLLGNAVKYTPDGGAVEFRVESRPNQIVFEVQDSGIGIAADELARVFEKFYRSHDERVADLSGNGLGLAFSQEIARLHGGRITAESTLNEGSTFALRLPLTNGG